MRKAILFIMVFAAGCFFPCGVLAQGVPEATSKVTQIKCELQTQKKIYHKREPIVFTCICQSQGEKGFFVPQHLTALAAEFDPHIILQDEKGNQYQFIGSAYITQNESMEFISLRNKDPLYRFKFPERDGRLKLVDGKQWALTKEHQISKRQELFDKAFKEVPVGKYTAWVDNRLSWQTVTIGNTNVVVTNFQNYGNEDEGAVVLKWEIGEISPIISFEVKP